MKLEDIKDDGSGYGSHLPILNMLFRAYPSIEHVVEFGMGNFSTKYFMCQQCELMSVEMQSEEWFAKMSAELMNEAKEHWTPVLALGATEWKTLKYPDVVNLCFVDGHAESRADCVQFMFDKAMIIVCHDFECPVYEWSRIQKPNDFKLVVYHHSDVQTGVFIHESLLN